jgi:hypothetical protein
MYSWRREKMNRRASRKAIFGCVAALTLTFLLMAPLCHALQEVEEFVAASDGTKIPWGIKKGYEQSDDTGKNLDPIMYYGHKPDVDKATPIEVAKAWWYQIRGQYADNLYGAEGGMVKGFDVGALVTKTNKRKIRRDSATRRWVTNWPKLDGVDYKDTTLFLSPEDLRGIATVFWHYADFEKDYDQWVWIPVLRKVRKLSAMEGEDSFGGMDFDYDDMVVRHPFQDTYKQIRIDVVDDKFIEEQKKIMSAYNSKDTDRVGEYFKKEAFGHKMWVLESFPKLTRMSYNKRIIWFEQDTWRLVKCDWYDEGGRKVRDMYRTWALSPFYESDKKHTFEDVIFAGNALTGHHTEMNVLKITFNNPKCKPEVFSVRWLMKRRW